jgi:mannose-1-phosphate guanylyltransferase
MVNVVILCGGVGTRLWPLSRKNYPKQFMILPGEKYNLFEQTLIRSQQLDRQCTQLIIISNESMKDHIIKALLNIHIMCPVVMIWEPMMRNTGPAIANLVKYLSGDCGEDTQCLVLPSDHLMSVSALNHSLMLANELVTSNIVTFGICPSYPEVGYGYIMEGANHTISRFIEKPPYDVALKLIEDPKCYWNAGVFYFDLNIIGREYQRLCPDLMECIEVSYQYIDEHTFKHICLDANRYSLCPNIPVDKLIMERTNCGSVVPFRGMWSDIGSWEAISKVVNNYVAPNVYEVDTKHCHTYNYQPDKVISLIGVEDLCVVNTEDAVLISKLTDTQKVKNVVQILPDQYI